jgi:crooked neck
MSRGGSSLQPKNRGAAAIQITAEQLLREAKERGLEEVERAPTQFITDKEELLQYQAAKRKDFEDQLRRNRQHFGIWCRYGLWEASLNEFERSRSVFERAIDVDYRQQMIWVKYAEMEMKHKFVNHARNIWDRCVTLHPRVDTFWYKYTYMEELVGAAEAARQVFERWMQWEPDDLAWGAYIQFEMRQGEVRVSCMHRVLMTAG